MTNDQQTADSVAEIKLGRSIQVRLVSDLKQSQAYYRDVLGCKVDDWGHAERGEMLFILQQAASHQDIKPNAVAQKRMNYPTDWEGPDHGWDSFIHISWEELDLFVEEVRSKGGKIVEEPFMGIHGNWEFKNAIISDLDGYHLVLGAMRPNDAG